MDMTSELVDKNLDLYSRFKELESDVDLLLAAAEEEPHATPRLVNAVRTIRLRQLARSSGTSIPSS